MQVHQHSFKDIVAHFRLNSVIDTNTEPDYLHSFLEFFLHAEAQDYLWILEHCFETGYFTDRDPPWAEELMRRVGANTAHQFILHRNVNDYVFDWNTGYTSLINVLIERLQPSASQFLLYNRSEGVFNAGSRWEPTQIPKDDLRDRWTHFLDTRSSDFRALFSGNNPPDPASLLLALEETLRQKRGYADPTYKTILLMEYAEYVTPANAADSSDPAVLIQLEALQRWALDPTIRQNKNIILLLSRNLLDIAPELRSQGSGVTPIAVPLPDEDARLKFIVIRYVRYLSAHLLPDDDSQSPPILQFEPQSYGPADKPLSQLKSFASRTSGLNRRSIEEIMDFAVTHNDGIVTGQLLRDRKAEILRSDSGNLLEVIEPRRSMDSIGGMRAIKQHLIENVLNVLREGTQQQKSVMPSGILFLGPPGTGKSALAEALATESSVNFVKLGNFRDQFVGQSERNLANALDLIRAMSPVVVFIDEIDQSEGQRGEQSLDSGVSTRIFSQLLQTMGDPKLRGRVVWIGASNRPDLIDAAMRRPGRFDEKIPFLMPDIQDRVLILSAILQDKFGIAKHKIDSLVPHNLPGTEGMTGAELEVIANRAYRHAMNKNRALETSDLVEAIQNFIPGRDEAKYRLMELLALADINDKLFIPLSYEPFFERMNDGSNRRRLDVELEKLRNQLRAGL